MMEHQNTASAASKGTRQRSDPASMDQSQDTIDMFVVDHPRESPLPIINSMPDLVLTFPFFSGFWLSTPAARMPL
jgi:hypothetical protein